jgi:hypothetical protein
LVEKVEVVVVVVVAVAGEMLKNSRKYSSFSNHKFSLEYNNESPVHVPDCECVLAKGEGWGCCW